MRALGVGCIIWHVLLYELLLDTHLRYYCSCLDDEELDLLGASWPQYHAIAQVVGLDVLRYAIPLHQRSYHISIVIAPSIPIPEGLTPITPTLFDQHLSYIINAYTLQGIPVLVHCRGGVGQWTPLT